MSLPMFTDLSDIDLVTEILSTKIKEVTEDEAKKLNKKAFTENNLKTYEFLGLVEISTIGIRLTDSGREYSNSDNERKKNDVLKLNIKKINIYDTTLEYMHHNQKMNPTKTEIGSYWNENFTDKVKEMTEDQISSAVIFFLRLVERVDLGKFIHAGRGRETRIDLDNVNLAEYVTLKMSKKQIPIITEKYSDVAQQADTVITEKKQNISDDDKGANIELSPSSLRALGKLEMSLSWTELDSNGAKKLIIEKLDDLQQENTVLKAKVEKMYSIDKKNAVLEEKNKILSNINLARSSINSIGGIILGASFSVTEIVPKIIGVCMGALLIVLSFLYREKSKKDKNNDNE